MDTIILSLLFSIPILIVLIIPSALQTRIRIVLSFYFLVISVIFLFFEIASWPFLDQYSSRPNQLFFQYLSHPKEVLLMVWAQYKLLVLSFAIFLYYFIKYAWIGINQLNTASVSWPYWKQLVVLPFAILLLTLGARSGIGQANANPGLAAFSNQHLTNQISQNATYSLLYAIYTSIHAPMEAEKLFGKMESNEIIQRIKKYMDVAPADFTDKNVPTLHIQRPTVKRDKPLNLVIIVMESLGSDYIGTQGGYNLTPNFDALSKEGVLFTNLYSIGTRTSRGMEALVSGYLPSPKSSSVMRMDLAQHNFFTIASLLKDFDYQTRFIYGGEAHFDNMAAFFLGNGFDKVIDENDFENPGYYGTWGVSDEDIFNKANNTFVKLAESNFLSVILTVSNHPPYDFPENKIQLYEEPANTAKNSTKYSDYALGHFFKQAKKEAYFKNTVFLITGDHPMLIRAKSLVPVDKYKIPGLIIAPGLEPKRVDSLASQIDLLPTALGLLGMQTEHPMIGRNLLMPSGDAIEKQVSIYSHSIAFRVNNKVSIHQPYKKAKTFLINKLGEFESIETEAEFEKDALAHILFPVLAYRKQIYH